MSAQHSSGQQGSGEAIPRYKRAAAEAAVAEVADGMRVGLGSGTTAAFAIQALGRRVVDGLRISCFASSLETERLALDAGLNPLPFATQATLDLTIDGVDEIDSQFRAIKGGGGALLREKILATAATRMIAIADDRKCVDRLGDFPLPVEVLPFAQSFIAARIAALGGTPNLRRRNGEAVLTDQQNHILDCTFADMGDPAKLAATLAAIPGVIAHGLFLTEIDALVVAGPDGLRRLEKQA